MPIYDDVVNNNNNDEASIDSAQPKGCQQLKLQMLSTSSKNNKLNESRSQQDPNEGEEERKMIQPRKRRMPVRHKSEVQLQIHGPLDLCKVGGCSDEIDNHRQEPVDVISEKEDEEEDSVNDGSKSCRSEDSDEPNLTSSHCSSPMDDFSRRHELST